MSHTESPESSFSCSQTQRSIPYQVFIPPGSSWTRTRITEDFSSLSLCDEPSNIRVVIVGKTRAGKSSTANTIFGEKLFMDVSSARSGTEKCQAATRFVNGRKYTLIDSPGFFDTSVTEEALKHEMKRCITMSAPGPHAFLIVLKVEKYTEHEQAVITKIKEYFSEEVFKYSTVVFTHGDLLQEGQTIEDIVCKDQNLSDLVRKCGDRCHVIDNKYWKDKPMNEYRSNKFQVEKLLQTIDKTIRDNNNRCYTNEMLQAVWEEMQRGTYLGKRSTRRNNKVFSSSVSSLGPSTLGVVSGPPTGDVVLEISQTWGTGGGSALHVESALVCPGCGGRSLWRRSLWLLTHGWLFLTWILSAMPCY
ncbi:GTPase IMAP family member 7-like [Halichoeres trimaculatus]|uniref:GTPase IMAP family member 7-like n=1 Tax=Halichoeres trimaculatus TaxID=147232 RepID=UPI003D9F9CF2